MMEQDAPVRSFTQLTAWQKARAVRKAIRVLVKDWPSEEKYRLVDQIIRSSRGPCSHIAEGFGRFHEKDNVRFCRIAKGSLLETQDHLSAAYDEGYVNAAVLKEHWAMVEEVLRVLNGYVRYLNRLGANYAAEPSVPYGNGDGVFGPVPDDLSSEDDLADPATDN